MNIYEANHCMAMSSIPRTSYSQHFEAQESFF